ncbi:COG3650 family protein [Terricaulis sp.]|uniref:COG3650 family protein n=1 Tax=Terricaulis sp. TaxID=2768686 RepID=UPI0037843665
MRVFVFSVMIAALAACGQPQGGAATATETATTATATTAADASTRPSWENARAEGVDFRGVGQEPGWLLDIYTQDRIVLQYDYGEHTAEFPLPQPGAAQEGATRYETSANGQTLTVTIRRFPCQDAMSGQDYPSTVEVIIDGRTLQGCGRSV